MKVDVAGLVAAAQKLYAVATAVQGLLPESTPLAPDTTSVGAGARLDMASKLLWGSACQQAYSLHTAAAHLMMIAAKFATQEEANKYKITDLVTQVAGIDVGALATLDPVAPITPDARIPLPPLTNLSGEGFSQLVTVGSSAIGVGFSNTATNNGIAVDTAAATIRQVAASVPEIWDSPTGTAALSGRLLDHANALNTIGDRWLELGDQARRHADDYSQTVAAVPKPREFKDNEAALRQAQAANDPIAASQLIQQRGVLEQRAVAEANRYAAVTETSTSPTHTGEQPGQPGVGPGGAPSGVSPAGAGAPAGANAAPGGAQQLAKAGATEAGQAGDAAGQMAQLIPQALGAIGGLVGGMAGMAGQIPQALMQTGQGLAQTATQGLSGLASKNASGAELDNAVGGAFKPEELSKAKASGGAGGGGSTHPAGALGPPVTPSTSHTPPTVPSGASAPAAPTPTGGSAMGGMPMGMPMSGLMPHGAHGGDGAGEKVAADKKVVVPPQPHTEPVTGKVSDRTAAAAEAARARAESDDPDDQPPHAPVLRRITLAPLRDEGP